MRSSSFRSSGASLDNGAASLPGSNIQANSSRAKGSLVFGQQCQPQGLIFGTGFGRIALSQPGVQAHRRLVTATTPAGPHHQAQHRRCHHRLRPTEP